jgi:hypothetical protein
MSNKSENLNRSSLDKVEEDTGNLKRRIESSIK